MNQNVLQGIKIQEKYLHDIEENGESNIVFADAIKDLGFSSLDDFFSQKSLYLMRQALCGNYLHSTTAEIMNLSRRYIQSKEYVVVDADTDTTCVHLGQGKDTVIDMDYCMEHGIEIYPYDGYGGAIVSGKGDYSLTMVLPDNIDIGAPVVLNQIKTLLLQHFNDVEVQGNDVLLDGKKVVGATTAQADGVVFLGFAVSFAIQPTVVTAVCGTPRTGKQIGNIDPEIYSREQFKKELLEWLLKL